MSQTTPAVTGRPLGDPSWQLLSLGLRPNKRLQLARRGEDQKN